MVNAIRPIGGGSASVSTAVWAERFLRDTDQWMVIALELAGDNPAEARRIRRVCTYGEIATAWINSRRKLEGVGYKVNR